MKFILGTKENMTQFFTEEGLVIPATIISVPKSVVTQVKTVESDGYNAIQLASGERKEKNIAKAQIGHFAGKGNFRFVKEFRLKGENTSDLKIGDELTADIFETGDMVAVSGISKGKGFQGGVKRHGFKGAPTSHGHRHDTRKVGSIGATGPQRVFKGTRMAGRMGSDRITVKNLEVVAIDAKNNQLLVKGALPGKRGTMLEIMSK
ncbi:MAG: 50S ribosomal protein L3 [Minisyncoccia bacterium]